MTGSGRGGAWRGRVRRPWRCGAVPGLAVRHHADDTLGATLLPAATRVTRTQSVPAVPVPPGPGCRRGSRRAVWVRTGRAGRGGQRQAGLELFLSVAARPARPRLPPGRERPRAARCGLRPRAPRAPRPPRAPRAPRRCTPPAEYPPPRFCCCLGDVTPAAATLRKANARESMPVARHCLTGQQGFFFKEGSPAP